MSKPSNTSTLQNGAGQPDEATHTIPSGAFNVERTGYGVSVAQERFLRSLFSDLQAQEAEFESARKAKEKASQIANAYLFCLAEEQDIPLGRDGWVFDHATFRFVKNEVPPKEVIDNGND